ncbi:MAG TPA: hypothetical protein VH092_23720 [Urbifossiella sp.]|jgi:hypothetical protein|nr:hypothetical protein [Urbifossiella sp.]
MSDPLADIFKSSNLHTLKSVGHHMLSSARERGDDTGKPLAFIGLVTIAIGVVMLANANRQTGRGR